MVFADSNRLSATDCMDAPHISQFIKEGWFSNVHRGHINDALLATAANDVPSLSSMAGGAGVGLLAMADIAALTTSISGGFMPQARHGASGVRAFAAAGSKLEGTGFEKEHMGQTQVALWAGTGAGEGVKERDGLPLSGVIESDVCTLLEESGVPRDGCFEGLGWSVILGADLRKPACDCQKSRSISHI